MKGEDGRKEGEWVWEGGAADTGVGGTRHLPYWKGRRVDKADLPLFVGQEEECSPQICDILQNPRLVLGSGESAEILSICGFYIGVARLRWELERESGMGRAFSPHPFPGSWSQGVATGLEWCCAVGAEAECVRERVASERDALHPINCQLSAINSAVDSGAWKEHPMPRNLGLGPVFLLGTATHGHGVGMVPTH